MELRGSILEWRLWSSKKQGRLEPYRYESYEAAELDCSSWETVVAVVPAIMLRVQQQALAECITALTHIRHHEEREYGHATATVLDALFMAEEALRKD